jgi:hypothetical protein
MWVRPPPGFAPIGREQQNAWQLGNSLPGVKFKMGDEVNVVRGAGAGEHGQLISIYSVDPEPLYHVETSNNEDLYARQSEIEARTP